MRLICFISALIIGLCLTSPSIAASADSQQAQQAKAELQELRAKIDEVRHSIQQGDQRHKQLDDQLIAAGRAVRQAEKRLDFLEENIAELEQRIDELQHEVDEEQANLADELQLLRRQIRAAYRTGRVDKLRLLLSGDRPEAIGRTLKYYEYFAQAQTEQIQQLKDTLDILTQHRAELEEQHQALDAQRQSRRQTLDDLKANQDKRKQALAALDARQHQRKNNLQDYEQDADDLEATISEIQKRLESQVAQSPEEFLKLRGQIPPPVNGPLLARFGQKKLNGKTTWKGQWREAAVGTPVTAAAAGQVVYVGYLHHYGLIVVLKHAKTYFTVYGHNQAVQVEVGDMVSTGQTLALAGHSGGHEQSGSYFEIRKNKQALNPAQWLKN